MTTDQVKRTFEKVETQIDFSAQELSVLAFWKQNHTFTCLQAKNKGKPKWSFLDGPITANNPMGVHHAWGRTLKDAYQRYFAMTGHELRYQNGFDCQGLWVEVEVEKELGLRSKREIESLVPQDSFASIDHFVKLCKERVDRFAKVQTEQSERLGYWMDWDGEEDWRKPADERRSYFTMSQNNNYTIWSFLKKCHDRKLIYRGYDLMPWCPRCAVGLSQMEMHEGYGLVAHQSVFVRFPLRGRPDENLLVWTTTPWTLTSNVAAAVNPQLTYLKIAHQGKIYYLAKGAFTAARLHEEFKQKQWIEGVPKLKSLEQIFKEKGGFEVLAELPGTDLTGWAYDGPFDELPAQNHPAGFPAEIADVAIKQNWGSQESARSIHRVIGWNGVGEQEGTGIVHIAPGCGKEDFYLSKDEKLVPIAPLDEYGAFLPGFAELEGKKPIDPETTGLLLASLKNKGILFAAEQYPHSYPHCWRCKTELLFRLVDEWFINMSWRDEVSKTCHEIRWIPEFGLQRELDWLKNMGDWMISKKRFWGLALPIWVCSSCQSFDVIGGAEELRQKAVEGFDRFAGHSPHRPWIDLVKIKCEKCGGLASRISDVGNPWLDAGIVAYSTMGYNTDREYWQQWFPADFITECFPGQFRNWFYALLAMSAMMTGRAPFKVLLGHALVRDEKGNEMHKSRGNSILFEEAAEKMSADLMRWMFCRQNPVNNINFGYGPADTLRNKFVLKLWNTYAFFCNYARLDEFDPAAPQIPVAQRPDIDRWILSDLQLLVQCARREYENFSVMNFCSEAEKFIDDRLSNWYIRRNRRRFWKSERGADKDAAYQTLYTVLTTLTRLFAPIMPFLCETMHHNLNARCSEAASVHLSDFPVADESYIDRDLSAEMNALLRIVSLGSAARNGVKIKVRQPLAHMCVRPASDYEQRAVNRFADQICEELNIKEVSLKEGDALLCFTAKANARTLAPRLGADYAEAEKALKDLPPSLVQAKLEAGQPLELACARGVIIIEPEDIAVNWQAPAGHSGMADGKTQILLDVRISEALAREGMAREAVRHIQELRKTSKLEPEDRIEIYLKTDSKVLAQALAEHKVYVGTETLAVSWQDLPLATGSHACQAKIDGQPLHIEIARAKPPA
jgi:isoleucyl-tRNA synthetase